MFKNQLEHRDSNTLKSQTTENKTDLPNPDNQTPGKCPNK